MQSGEIKIYSLSSPTLFTGLDIRHLLQRIIHELTDLFVPNLIYFKFFSLLSPIKSFRQFVGSPLIFVKLVKLKHFDRFKK